MIFSHRREADYKTITSVHTKVLLSMDYEFVSKKASLIIRWGFEERHLGTIRRVICWLTGGDLVF